MRGALAALAYGALAACSAENEAGNEPRADSQPNSTIAAPKPALGAAAPAAPSAGVGGLQAQVSSLSANTSGFNVRITDTSTIVDLASDALFAFDSAKLSTEATSSLAKTADLIRAGAPGNIAIVGHTDAKGDDAYNQRLSEQRAQAVANWMMGQVGVRLRSFAVSGQGEASPVAPNAKPDGSDDPGGRAKNRRVEIVIPKG